MVCSDCGPNIIRCEHIITEYRRQEDGEEIISYSGYCQEPNTKADDWSVDQLNEESHIEDLIVKVYLIIKA